MQHAWYQGRIDAALLRRNAKGLLRVAKSYQHLGPALLRHDGRDLVNFGSNDYLGLSWHPAVITAASPVGSAAGDDSDTDYRNWGSGASPLVTGRTADHAALEQHIAHWKQFDAALTFSSGYATNVSVISALANSSDYLFADELNHASLIDGCRLAKAHVTDYRHNDYDHLESCLSLAARQRLSGSGFWIVSDTVFSMEGDVCDVARLIDLARRYDAGLIFDEAHAVGIYGPRGSGLAERSALGDIPIACVGTCSKALGSIGGYVASDSRTIEYLRQFARGYIYSTAQPAPAARATSAAIELCSGMDASRERIRTRARQFRQSLIERGFRTTGTDSPIVPVYLSSSQAVVGASQQLMERGFYVPAIRPPTVPIGRDLLRISISLAHSDDQVTNLLNAISDVS